MKVMKVLVVARVAFESLLDAIIPHKERSARTKARVAEDIPLSPTSHDLLGVRITTLMDYQQEEVQDLIRSLKYDHSKAAAQLAAELLTDYLREEIASERIFSPHEIIIVPVPLHKKRERERGFNQIEFVLRELPAEFRDGTLVHLKTDILERVRATLPQTKLHRSDRLSNVAGAFALKTNADVSGMRVYLIDDVTTTGATLANAATPLRRAGAEVTLLALARA